MLYSLSHRKKDEKKDEKSLSDEFLFLFCSALLSLFLFSFECVVSIADSAISGKSASIKWWKAQLESHSMEAMPLLEMPCEMVLHYFVPFAQQCCIVYTTGTTISLLSALYSKLYK